MKKINYKILLPSLLMIFSKQAQCQISEAYKNGLSLSMGLSGQVVVNAGNTSSRSMDDYKWSGSPLGFKSGLTYSGPIVLGYQRKFGKRWEFGLNFAASYFKKQEQLEFNKEAKYKMYYLGVGLEGHYNYFQTGRLHLYVAGSLGAAYKSSTQSNSAEYWNVYSDTKIIPLYQITPIGISYGHKVKVFAEGGIGYKGFANIGLQINY